MGWGTSLINGAKRITGVDISEEAVAEANRRYGNLATFKIGDMCNLDFEDESFDVISCLEGIEHVPMEIGEMFLKESERLLRPDGILLLILHHIVGRCLIVAIRITFMNTNSEEIKALVLAGSESRRLYLGTRCYDRFFTYGAA